MTEKDGGAAFPGVVERPVGGLPGMRLRDWFAGQVLPAVYAASVARGDELQETIVAEAYELADGMLAERAKVSADEVMDALSDVG